MDEALAFSATARDAIGVARLESLSKGDGIVTTARVAGGAT